MAITTFLEDSDSTLIGKILPPLRQYIFNRADRRDLKIKRHIAKRKNTRLNAHLFDNVDVRLR